MPRGQKHKHRKHEKQHHAKDDSQDHRGTQDSTEVEEKPSSSSTTVFENIPEKSSASLSNRKPEGPCNVPPIDDKFNDAVAARFSESGNSLDQENLFCSDCLPCSENPCSSCIDMNVALVEQFLLYKFKMKQRITKEDLLNVIDPKYRYHFPEILQRASECIEIVFAADVTEVDPTNHLYDLVSKLKLPNNGRICPGRGLPKTGLLMTLLGMIFMRGNSVTEEAIWKFLKMMQLYPGRKHFIYREPRKLITQDLVRLKYLEYRQVAGSDPPQYEFLWGPKAHAETSKRKVLEFMAKVNNAEPTAFLEKYEEALRKVNEDPSKSHHNAQQVSSPSP